MWGGVFYRMRIYLLIVFMFIASTGMGDDFEFLRTDGKNIVNASDDVMAMRGINFGGWLMMETWIPAIELEWHDHLPKLAKETGLESQFEATLKSVGEFNDDTMNIHDYLDRFHKEFKKHSPTDKWNSYFQSLQKVPPLFDASTLDTMLRQRFGDYGAAEIWNTFHEVWITETEFKLAKALGFNFVRIPFWYRWFESDEEPYHYYDYGFSYLDRAVQWARQNGLYVILDLHAAAGGQNPWDHSGELSRAELFQNEEYQRRTCRLWQQIAQHYQNEPVVFAYNALNEPFSAENEENWTEVHDAIYKAIRSVDKKHIIIMEDGYKLEYPQYAKTAFFPDPDTFGWQNVVYSFHFYETGKMERHEKKIEDVIQLGQRVQQKCNVPIYLGEFNTYETPSDISLKAMQHWLSKINEQGWHWSPWTFKYTNPKKDGSLWGVYQFEGDWVMPQFYRDSKSTILKKIAKMSIDHFTLHEKYATILKRSLLQPVQSAN